MTPQELKNSILQLAIQGKLVEQRPEEGTAEELYREIQKENISTIKAEPKITVEELPFDIPDTWKYVRVENIAILHNGRAYKQNELLERGKYPVLRVGNLFTSSKWYYSDLELEKEKYCDNEDLLYSWSASFGPYIWDGEKVIYHYHIWKIEFTKYVDKEYFYYFLLADTDSIKRSGHGLAMIHVTKAGTEKRILPLPPLAEQKRIVAKIEELLPLIDRYEKAWTRLEDFNKRFPGEMQKSILQMAIQGKLVEQRPEEGTGEELYQQIQKEKQALIKAGKIKKEKPLPEITEDEIPFDTPETWKWVRLPDVSSMCLGKMLDKQKNKGTSCPYLRNVNVRWGRFELSDLLKMKFEDEMDERFLIQPGDLVMCEGGEPGRCAVWKETYSIHFQKALHRIRFYDGLLSQFYQLLFYAYANGGILAPLFTGTTIKHLTGQALEKVLVPLPPLAEQKRIVARLEELLPLCEKLK